MASPPNSPVHLHVRKLSVTNEEGTSSQSSHRKPGKKVGLCRTFRCLFLLLFIYLFIYYNAHTYLCSINGIYE